MQQALVNFIRLTHGLHRSMTKEQRYKEIFFDITNLRISQQTFKLLWPHETFNSPSCLLERKNYHVKKEVIFHRWWVVKDTLECRVLWATILWWHLRPNDVLSLNIDNFSRLFTYLYGAKETALYSWTICWESCHVSQRRIHVWKLSFSFMTSL